MSTTIRAIKESDKTDVLSMMREFYSSSAVYTNGSDEIFLSDIEACISGSPYIEGYVFEDNKTVQGYAMLAKSFSTEFGRQCVWIEDVFIKPEHRGKGIGKQLLLFVGQKYPEAVIRLEVEKENEPAVELYKKSGFEFLPYEQMIRLPVKTK